MATEFVRINVYVRVSVTATYSRQRRNTAQKVYCTNKLGSHSHASMNPLTGVRLR